MMTVTRILCVFGALCGLAVNGFSLDREAFTFTNYDLNVRLEPEQQRLSARGKITLRNDSSAPQKNLSLQISSTLGWRSIQFEGKPVQFVSQPYASDIDHTGALSEAIVTLPREVPPKTSIDLTVGYEGVIALDTARLARIGMSDEMAKHSDWDQISPAFTAVRGVGYVAWYPVAMESANLSEANSVEETVARWRLRHAETTMSLLFQSTLSQPISFSGAAAKAASTADETASSKAAFNVARLGVDVPTFVTGNYQSLGSNDLVAVEYLPGQEEGARVFADAAAQIDPSIPIAHGPAHLQILGLPDRDAASFVSAGMLLCPLKPTLTNDAVLNIVYAKARNMAVSPRAWIQDGLARYAQVHYIEQNSGRQAALDYLEAHRQLLVDSASRNSQNVSGKNGMAQPLVNAPDDLLLQTKAMFVWWMLRDMLGENRDAFFSYSASDDKDPAYMQHVLEKQSHRDLQWFFDDWVYHDPGLPELRVESVYPRQLSGSGYIVTITIENVGKAGAEVPLVLRIQGGEVTSRLVVPANSKKSIRIEAAAAPTEVVVNDGSVPESNTHNNVYKIEALNH